MVIYTEKQEAKEYEFVKTEVATRICKDEDDTLTVTYFKAEEEATTEKKDEEVKKDKDRKTICLSADSFVYNENTNTYTVSLSTARLMRSDFIKGLVTFEINGKRIDKDKSDKADKQMDDKYIDSVLDEIERNIPDSDAED